MRIRGTHMSMIRGDTESFTVSCEYTDGTPRPFEEGDTVYFTVKTNVGSEERSLQKIIVNFENGEAHIEIFPQDTAHLKFGQYVYDIQLTKANGEVITIVPKSNFRLLGEVTYE